jgi:hypothetical protein
MTISSWPRLVIGTLLLMFSAATGLTAWSVETCIGDKAGSLWIGAFTLAINIAAWFLLGRRVPSKLVLLVALLPALAALSYTISTVQLAAGYLLHDRGACDVMRPGQEFGLDGREPLFIALWLLVCITFWSGLAPVVLRAIRVYGGSSDSDQ